MEATKEQNIILLWLYWQFYEMPVFLLGVWKNYLVFASNFFSVGLLFKTFFAPWRKYNWKYPKGFDLMEFFNTLISNTFSRILGAMMRIVLVVLGILFQVFVVIAGLIIFIGWIIIPLIIIAGFLFVFSF
jgi:hypothetical protein